MSRTLFVLVFRLNQTNNVIDAHPISLDDLPVIAKFNALSFIAAKVRFEGGGYPAEPTCAC